MSPVEPKPLEAVQRDGHAFPLHEWTVLFTVVALVLGFAPSQGMCAVFGSISWNGLILSATIIGFSLHRLRGGKGLLWGTVAGALAPILPLAMARFTGTHDPASEYMLILSVLDSASAAIGGAIVLWCVFELLSTRQERITQGVLDGFVAASVPLSSTVHLLCWWTCLEDVTRFSLLELVRRGTTGPCLLLSGTAAVTGVFLGVMSGKALGYSDNRRRGLFIGATVGGGLLIMSIFVAVF